MLKVTAKYLEISDIIPNFRREEGEVHSKQPPPNIFLKNNLHAWVFVVFTISSISICICVYKKTKNGKKAKFKFKSVYGSEMLICICLAEPRSKKKNG